MDIIEKIALEILEDFPIHYELPASLSGKHHVGETQRQHIETTSRVMKHLCRAFNITGKDKDILISAAWLHDIGIYVICKKGEIKLPGWKYYEATGFSRLESCMQLHPLIGSELLKEYELPHKVQIRHLVAVHMGHWYPACPQPKKLHEYLICNADYIATKRQRLFEDNNE